MGKRDSAERNFANFYDLYVDGFEGDLPIYLDLAAKHPGPVLEVGCRTGRVTTRLAEAGHEVVGLETQRSMLSLARARCTRFPDRVRLQHHDLRHHALPERFHAVFVTLYAFNRLIDVEEQRLLLRHVRRSIHEPGIVAIDCFCPLSLVCPDQVGTWRVIERTLRGHHLVVRDLREMLNPLLERRVQVYSVDSAPEIEIVTHRRYIPPFQSLQLLTEAGFQNVRWVQDYDLATVRAIETTDRPTGPFLILADI